MGEILAVSRLGNARSFTRAVTASVLGVIQEESPEKILRRTWARDEGARQILTRAAVSPTSTATYPSLDVIGSFVSLAPGSAALKLFDQSVKVDLSGITTVSIPHPTGVPAPAFVSEGAPAPVVMFSTAKTTIGPTCKILILSAVTRELEEAGPEAASAVIGQVLSDAAGRSIDAAAFDTNAAVPGLRPAGLLHGSVGLTPAAAGSDAMYEDVAALAGAIASANIDPSGIIYVCDARSAALIRMKTFNSITIYETLGLPPKTIAAFAPAGIASGFTDLPSIETARETVVHREDTNPLPLVAGSPGVMASPQTSHWQTEQIAIKIRSWCAWAAAPGAAQFVSGINW
jgi:hypothetical protein